MLKLTPIVRLLLTALAAAIGVLTAVSDTLPSWVQAVIVGCSVVLSALGIVPPHVPTQTVIVAEEQPPPAPTPTVR